MIKSAPAPELMVVVPLKGLTETVVSPLLSLKVRLLVETFDTLS